MTDLSNIENAVLTSQARYIGWEEKWRKDKLEPLLAKMLKQKYAMVSGDQKEALKLKDPVAYKNIKDIMENI